MNINGIEDYIVEGTNVSKLLRSNQIKAQANKNLKDLKRKNTIMEIGLIVGLIIIFATICILESRYNQKEINKCVNAGHSQTFCERGL